MPDDLKPSTLLSVKSAGPKHAINNPNLWINILSLFALVIPTLADQEWIKDNQWYLLAIGSVNFIITGALQILRDVNKPPKQNVP